MALLHEGWDHLRAGRPLAARASWQRAMRLEGGSPAAAQALATLESAADLPAAARADLPAPPAGRRGPPRGLGPPVARPRRRVATMPAPARATAAMGPAPRTSRRWPTLSAGWRRRNRPTPPPGTTGRSAWPGWAPTARRSPAWIAPSSSRPSRRADRAVEAWTLAELLRQGGGAEELADDLRFACTIDWDPGDTAAMLAEFPEIRRLPAPQAPGVEALPTLQVEIFEWPDQSESGPAPDRIETAAGLPIVLATVFVDRASRRLRLSSPRVDTLEQAEERLLSRIGADAGAGHRAIRPVREASPLPLPFLDADVWTVRVPGGLEPSRAEDLRRGWVEHYYEDIWIHRPRQGLGGLSPIAAADASHRGDAVIGAKLAAVIDFREQLASRPSALRLYNGYPFDRLRRSAGAPAGRACAPVDPADLSCAAPWELAALDPAALDDHRLADAVASAAGLLDDAIAAPLAVELLRRQSVPIAGVHLAGAVPSLLRRAMGSNDPDAAIGWIDRARPLADARTAEVLDLWRAEILARADRPDEALRAFSALIGSDAKGAAMALDAAETLIDNRHFDQARPLLEAARDLAQSNGLPWTARRRRSCSTGWAECPVLDRLADDSHPGTAIPTLATAMPGHVGSRNGASAPRKVIGLATLRA